MFNKLKNLFNKQKLKPVEVVEISTTEYKKVEKKIKNVINSKLKDHETRLLAFKTKLMDKRKKLPIITDPTYNRKYERLQAIKNAKEYKHKLVLEGKRFNYDKNIVEDVQQPYPQYPFQALDEYNRYARGFNYRNR